MPEHELVYDIARSLRDTQEVRGYTVSEGEGMGGGGHARANAGEGTRERMDESRELGRGGIGREGRGGGGERPAAPSTCGKNGWKKFSKVSAL